MMKNKKTGYFRSRLPTAERLKNSRFFKPFKAYLDLHFLWQFNRRAVAAGAAVGLFFGLLIPVFQIFFAGIAAIMLRANLPVAAACTLITNPFTFPPIYYLAYRIGSLLFGGPVASNEELAAESVGIITATVEEEARSLGTWFVEMASELHLVGVPLITGLLIMAVTASVIGFFGITVIWKWRIQRQWRKRRADRIAISI